MIYINFKLGFGYSFFKIHTDFNAAQSFIIRTKMPGDKIAYFLSPDYAI